MSETAHRIEKRLAELNRSMIEDNNIAQQVLKLKTFSQIHFAFLKNGERYYDHKLSSIEKGKLVELALNGLASPELSSLEEQEDTELLQPTNENRETVKSSVSGYKDKHLFSILQTNSPKNVKNSKNNNRRKGKEPPLETKTQENGRKSIETQNFFINLFRISK